MMVGGVCVTPIQPDNSDTQKQLEQWLKEIDVDELHQGEQGALSHLMAELQNLPSASISPLLEGRLEGLSRRQHTPSNPFGRFLALLSAGIATAGAVLVWQSSGLELQVAQKKPASAIAVAKAPSPPRQAEVTNKGFLLTSSQNPGAQVKVTIRPERATNLLVGQGLPQLPEGHIYRLWAETPLGLQGCMTFRPDAEGNSIIKVPQQPSGSAISLLISIDPVYEGSSAERPGKPVLASI